MLVVELPANKRLFDDVSLEKCIQAAELGHLDRQQKSTIEKHSYIIVISIAMGHLHDTLLPTCGVPGPVFAELGLDVGNPGLWSAFPPGPPPSWPGIFCCIIPIP